MNWCLLGVNQYRTSNFLLQHMQEVVIDSHFAFVKYPVPYSLIQYQLLSENHRGCSRYYWKMFIDKGNPNLII